MTDAKEYLGKSMQRLDEIQTNDPKTEIEKAMALSALAQAMAKMDEAAATLEEAKGKVRDAQRWAGGGETEEEITVAAVPTMMSPKAAITRLREEAPEGSSTPSEYAVREWAARGLIVSAQSGNRLKVGYESIVEYISKPHPKEEKAKGLRPGEVRRLPIKI